jgi:hypothetical protein
VTASTASATTQTGPLAFVRQRGSAAADYVGTPIKSGYPGSTGQANVLSFNIKGKDPISGTTIPAFSVVEVGATPIVFITERASVLANLTNASEQQLQEAFSGTNCDASAFGLPAGGIGIFLREPLSGTYNTTEATVMRHPTVYGGAGPSTDSWCEHGVQRRSQ